MSTAPDPDRWYHIGPHGLFDLVRLARRGRTTLVRVLYLLALFAVLYAVHERSSEDRDLRAFTRRGGRAVQQSINHNAQIAERFSYTILIAQCVAVMLLTPIYIAASVHEERDNRALSILYTTQLTARAILQGKLLARIGHVGSVVFAGLPLLALVQLWGGIDMPMIVANFWNTGLWLVSVGALSLMIATHTSSMIRSVLITYAFLACSLCCLCVPVPNVSGMIFLVRPSSDVADGYLVMLIWLGMLTFVHLGCALLFLYRAVKKLEFNRTDEPKPIIKETNEFEAMSNRFQSLPKMSDDVVAWKERFLGRGMSHFVPFFFMPGLIVLILGLITVWLERRSMHGVDETASYLWANLFKIVLLLSFGIYVFLVAAGTTGCIVRESQQQTLDALLLLPTPRRAILRSKVIGNLLRFWPWLAIAGSYWFCLMLFGSQPFLTGVVLLAAGMTHLTFFAILGIFLSVFCRTMLSAYVSMAVILLMLFAGPTFAEMLLRTSPFQTDLLHAINPVRCWIAIGHEWQLHNDETIAEWWVRNDSMFGATFHLCVMAYAVASMALWQAACRRFANRTS